MTEPALLPVKLAIVARRYRDAIDLLDQMPAGEPEDEARKLVLMGQCFEGLDDVPLAMDAYTQAQALAPTFPPPLLREAVLRYRLGDREAAQRLLHRYLRAEPGNPETLYYLYLCELDPHHRAEYANQLTVLDSPSGTWSSQLTGK
jgi:tetratricopeptide (TPR) repeat protein